LKWTTEGLVGDGPDEIYKGSGLVHRQPTLRHDLNKAVSTHYNSVNEHVKLG